ncbi:hypothetical protein CLCR_06452 [Cladophialophora carrionii]|uniref:Uncharacterized protein n=1 Tax=Cladophialophora carrionii TaxID=86049 RepID=A0A1C1CA11_9EURO|nr:hypothetical protein CLCR_06452 [Cladophialophora carrionii]
MSKRDPVTRSISQLSARRSGADVSLSERPLTPPSSENQGIFICQSPARHIHFADVKPVAVNSVGILYHSNHLIAPGADRGCVVNRIRPSLTHGFLGVRAAPSGTGFTSPFDRAG